MDPRRRHAPARHSNPRLDCCREFPATVCAGFGTNKYELVAGAVLRLVAHLSEPDAVSAIMRAQKRWSIPRFRHSAVNFTVMRNAGIVPQRCGRAPSKN